MFTFKPEHIRRVSFATRLFPKLKTFTHSDSLKLKSNDEFDGTTFCGGRSKNKDLLTYFGFIAPGAYENSFVQLPTFRRSLKKLINLVEHELETLGSQEVLLPTLVPQKLWEQSKRIERQSTALDNVYKIDDNLLLGPTFEETITRLVAEAGQIHEYELPLLLYQTSNKFRNEPNPKFGLLRTNEFLMNDLYSFDADLERAMQTYENVSKAYDKIFKRLGMPYVKIESGTGDIGGKYSHEYQLQAPSGEDTIVQCDKCHCAFNEEMFDENRKTCKECGNGDTNAFKRSKAVELGHTFLLSDIYSRPFKAKYTSQDGRERPIFEMGCYGLGLTRILGAGIDLFSLIPDGSEGGIMQLRWPSQVEPYRLGLVGPAARSKQYHAGSTQFVERVTDRILSARSDMDLLIEDRGKEGILRRVSRLQSLGIPNIITVGQRFLQDQPEVELLRLDAEKKDYEQLWLSEEQLYDYVNKLDS